MIVNWNRFWFESHRFQWSIPDHNNSNKFTSLFKVLMYLLLFRTHTIIITDWLASCYLLYAYYASSMISQKTIYLKEKRRERKKTRAIKILTNKVPLKRERHGMRDRNHCKLWHSLPTVNDYAYEKWCDFKRSPKLKMKSQTSWINCHVYSWYCSHFNWINQTFTCRNANSSRTITFWIAFESIRLLRID